MPRISGVSLSSTVLFNRVSPIPRKTLRCFAGLPIMLRTSFIFIVSAIYLIPWIILFL
jgi:hypothetical protein